MRLAATITIGTAAAASAVAFAVSQGGSECTAHDGLPDRKCTPGATYAGVTQANIQRTICVHGWTATIRPPLVVTEPIKRRDVKRYGEYNGPSLRGYEEDHLIPLELGGDPATRKNLWPEAHPASFDKDRVENRLRVAVCAGRRSLRSAQRAIATDWRHAG